MDFRLDELKSAMIIQTKKNDIVANNLANIDTIGFKKDYTFFNAFKKELEEVNNLSIHTVKDFTQGDFEETNNPLDFALSGGGFFTIEVASEKVYTRNGHFELDPDGFLTDSEGNYVLGQQGRINLTQNFDTVSNIFVSSEGEIYVDDIPVDYFQIANFDENTQVERLSGSVFRVKNSESLNTKNNNNFILQGRIEKSNVNPVSEMVNLIEIERGFESSQKTIRILDDILSKASSQLSRV
ncbi:MAG: flagellar hook-basal body protein [Candidatus Marinimicrobia bacterium]|nr:flagellar hook-basal body protein [Candidatus Neomarinimicrobiota bacterium]